MNVTRFAQGLTRWPCLVAIVCTTCCLGCDARDKVTATMTFEVDRQAAGLVADQPLDRLPELVDVLNARLDGQGRARATKDSLIEVDMFGELSDADFVRLVKRLEASGSLEFRILANAQFDDDRAIIEKAVAVKADEHALTDEEGTIARWVPLVADEPRLVEIFQADWTPDESADERDDEEVGASKWANPSGFAVRTTHPEGDEKPRHEILVLEDPFDVTGKHLERVFPSTYQGEYAIDFAFNDEGARRFGLLTRENQPTLDGRKRYLAIILNGSLHSAPTINSVITKHGQITGYGGEDGEQERDEVLSVLKSGELPYPLKLKPAEAAR